MAVDYLDADVAYLLGLIVARGELVESPFDYRIIINFPSSAIQVQGINLSLDQQTEIKLGLLDISNRLRNLLEADIDLPASSQEGDYALTVHFRRRNLAWRNLRMLLGEATDYRSFQVPSLLAASALELIKEFVRGFADVAGNVRFANRYTDGRNRVRLDVLNYIENWQLPVQLCQLLQDQLDIPVQLITWGHPNLGRDFREHQLNIFAVPFLKVGFSFRHKQLVLEELAKEDLQKYPQASYNPCPGQRRVRDPKPDDPREHDQQRLPQLLLHKHFNAYWEICRALGCPKRPKPPELPLLDSVDET
ncbi:MAG: hypothetical protein RMM31_07200 [Anaerolineae bacterium]|nr:hypothetical protein [Anaerolineae bacterium]